MTQQGFNPLGQIVIKPPKLLFVLGQARIHVQKPPKKLIPKPNKKPKPAPKKKPRNPVKRKRIHLPKG